MQRFRTLRMVTDMQFGYTNTAIIGDKINYCSKLGLYFQGFGDGIAIVFFGGNPFKFYTKV